MILDEHDFYVLKFLFVNQKLLLCIMWYCFYLSLYIYIHLFPLLQGNIFLNRLPRFILFRSQ